MVTRLVTAMTRPPGEGRARPVVSEPVTCKCGRVFPSMYAKGSHAQAHPACRFTPEERAQRGTESKRRGSRRRGVQPRQSDEERFWAGVDRRSSGECWPWLKSRNPYGYGQLRAGRQNLAHRYSYQLMRGPIPDGLGLDHLCRNRACVNPAHLEPVTSAENTRRGANSLKTHCPVGHPYSGDNLSLYRGARRCKACRRDYMRTYVRRAVAA